jgi:hypothetical protein
MAEQQTNLLSFYKGWDAYQALLIKAIAPLSSEQLALRGAPHLRPIGENVAHIISGRVSNFHLLLGEGSADLAPLEQWDVPGAPPRSATELVSGLEVCAGYFIYRPQITGSIVLNTPLFRPDEESSQHSVFSQEFSPGACNISEGSYQQ